MDHKIRKNKKSYTIYDMYQNFDENVSYFDFKRILSEFNKTILNSIQDRSEVFKMPYGLGYICIVKYKPKKLSKEYLSNDYKLSKEYGKTIYHLNEHSDGFKFRLFWSKLPQTFPNRYKYQLQFVRQNKRRLAQNIFNNKDYININDLQIYKM